MISAQNYFIDLFNLRLHRAVAEELQRNPKDVLRIVRENIENWAKNECLALSEWREIIETETPEEIIKIISQNTDEGQRLRSSSPFAGVLSEEEREKIWNECAEISTV